MMSLPYVNSPDLTRHGVLEDRSAASAAEPLPDIHGAAVALAGPRSKHDPITVRRDGEVATHEVGQALRYQREIEIIQAMGPFTVKPDDSAPTHPPTHPPH